MKAVQINGGCNPHQLKNRPRPLPLPRAPILRGGWHHLQLLQQLRVLRLQTCPVSGMPLRPHTITIAPLRHTVMIVAPVRSLKQTLLQVCSRVTHQRRIMILIPRIQAPIPSVLTPGDRRIHSHRLSKRPRPQSECKPRHQWMSHRWKWPSELQWKAPFTAPSMKP